MSIGRGLMKQSVTVELRTGSDAYGAPTYTGATTHKARVRGTTQLIRAADGQPKVANTVAHIDSPPAGIDAQSRVTLPDNTTPPVAKVDTYPDRAGSIDHARVFF